MTNEEAKEWVAGLKPGDKVIHINTDVWPNQADKVLIVSKTTPSGIVRCTNETSYKKFGYLGRVAGYGRTRGYIVPYTEESYSEVITFENQEKQRNELMNTIEHARELCYSVYCRRKRINYDQAKKIIELLGEKDEKL